MSELSREARALIDAAKERGPELLGPSPAERARLRERLGPLWAAEAARPRALPRWRRWLWVGSAALLAGLGLGLRTAATRAPAAAGGVQLAAAASQPEHVADAARADAAPGDASLAALAARPPVEPAPGVLERGARAGATPLPATGRVARADASPPAHARQSVAAVGGERPPRELRSASLARAKDAAGCARPGTCPAPRADEAAACRPAGRCDRSAAATDEVAPSARPASAQRAGPSTTTPPAERSSAGLKTESRPGPRSIEGELELLGDAQQALQAQRPSQALRLLQEHAFRFPAGALADERTAMQALALCAQGRKQTAASLLCGLAARGSGSALLPRVRKQCGL